MKNQSLIKYIKAGKVSRVESMLTAGTSPNVKEEDWSALHWAAQSGSPRIVEMLLSFGAHVNEVDNLGITPLAVSVGVNDIEISRILIKGGAEVCKKIDAYEGGEVIHLACSFGYENLAILLVEEGGADLMTPDNEGKTALDFARDAEASMILKHYSGL